MKIKFILLFSIFLVAYCTPIYAQDPITEDIMGIFDDDDEEEIDDTDSDQNNNSAPKGIKLPGDQELKNILTVMDNAGALGGIFSNAVSSGEMILGRDCSGTYVCMYNTLRKLVSIFEYEYTLKQGGLACIQERSLLENYSLFLLSINLDLYCIEHLSEVDEIEKKSTLLSDEELIDAMLAMGQVAMQVGAIIPRLIPYAETYKWADPFCANDLSLVDMGPGTEFKKSGCSCGEFTGTLDESEKNKVIADIQNIIESMNPGWQAQKAVEINRRLKELPCNK